MCPWASGHIHTSVQAGGTARARMRLRTLGLEIGLPFRPVTVTRACRLAADTALGVRNVNQTRCARMRPLCIRRDRLLDHAARTSMVLQCSGRADAVAG